MYACMGVGVYERTRPRIPTRQKVIASERPQPTVFLRRGLLALLFQAIGQVIGKLNKRVIPTTNDSKTTRVYVQLRAHLCSLSLLGCGRYVGHDT